MNGNTKGQILAVIPARYGSSRFPGKMLALLKNRTLIEWVWGNLKKSKRVSRAVIATDDERIQSVALGFGAEVVMTSPDHPSGTDRIAEVVDQLNLQYDWIVNVQGDEPLLKAEILDSFIERILDDSLTNCQMATLAHQIEDKATIHDPNVVKVVTDYSHRALYFSRNPIPFHRDATSPMPDYYQHLGIYAYTSACLKKIVSLPPSSLELSEKLEQLRALQHGIPIHVFTTDYKAIGVDTPEDLARVEALIGQSLN